MCLILFIIFFFPHSSLLIEIGREKESDRVGCEGRGVTISDDAFTYEYHRAGTVPYLVVSEDTNR